MNRVTLLLALSLASWSPAFATTDVTACGTTVAVGDVGVLQTDLDCSHSSPAVLLLYRATLDLNGHTIVGEPAVEGRAADGGTTGRVRFTVIGPGTIVGTSTGFFNACIVMNDGRARLTSATGRIDISRCTIGIVGSVTSADPDGRARITMDHVDVHDNIDSGVRVFDVDASDVTASNNGADGIEASRLTMADVTAHDNMFAGLAGERIHGHDVTTFNNNDGVFCIVRARLTNFVAMHHTNPGIEGCSRGMRLVDSTVTGNGLGPIHPMIDVNSPVRPILVNTVCGRSEGLGGTSTPWGVCTDD